MTIQIRNEKSKIEEQSRNHTKEYHSWDWHREWSRDSTNSSSTRLFKMSIVNWRHRLNGGGGKISPGVSSYKSRRSTSLMRHIKRSWWILRGSSQNDCVFQRTGEKKFRRWKKKKIFPRSNFLLACIWNIVLQRGARQWRYVIEGA